MNGIPMSLVLLGVMAFVAVLHYSEADSVEEEGTVEAGDDGAIDPRMKRQAEEGGGPPGNRGQGKGRGCEGRGRGRGRGGRRNSTSTTSTTETTIR